MGAAGSNTGTAAPTNSSVWSCASSDGQTATVGGTAPVASTTTVSSNGSDVDEDKVLFTMYVGFGAVVLVIAIFGVAILLTQRATHARLGAQKRHEAEEATVPGKGGTWSEEETVVAASARYGGGAAAVPASSEPVTAAANVSDPSISSALSSSSSALS